MLSDNSGTSGANIGRAACRKRRAVSIASTVVTVVMFVALRWAEAERSWYLLLFFPALSAILGLLQAQARTCVVLAARGLRDFDQGEEKIGDSCTIRSLRRRAILIYIESLVIALVFTAIVYWTS